MTAHAAYLRFPTIRAEHVAFVAEDDVWLVPATGGRAWRVTADAAPVAGTRLSPDGGSVAFTSRREGPPEVCVADLDGGGGRRLTFWGDALTQVIGWLDDEHVLAVSATTAPTRHETWAWSVPVASGPPRRLPLGPITGYAPGPGRSLVLGTDRNRRGAAAWKRYRGGDGGKLWLDPDGAGTFALFLTALGGQLEDPTWVGDRLALLSDHEGWANVYSVLRDGSDLRRHTDHGDAYARALAGDGGRLVYQCLGELYLLDDLAADSTPRRLDVVLGGPRTGRRPAPVDAHDALADVAPDRTGRASAVEVRGTVHWLTHRDGPVRALADTPGVRARLPRVLPGPAATAGGPADHAGQQVLRVSDADGEDALEIGPADGSVPARRIGTGRLGRVLELTGSPDGRLAAVTTHDGRLLVVDLTASGTAGGAAGGADPVRVVVGDAPTDVSSPAFSPDSRWLAWSHPGPHPLRHVRIADLRAPDGGAQPPVADITPLRFRDEEPVFTADGKHLAFLSVRTFDPVYDAQVFDMSFLAAQRPYLVPLAATTPSPFDPEAEGRPADTDDDDKHDDRHDDRHHSRDDRPDPASDSEQDDDASDDRDRPPTVTVDLDGLAARAVPLPVPGGRYRRLQAARNGLLWLEVPLSGELGESRSGDDEPKATLRRHDLRKRATTTLVDAVHDAWVSGDGTRVVVQDDDGLRVLPVDRSVDDDDKEAGVEVDLDRVRVVVDPAAMWRQMYAEQGRLMRDHFWVPDMGGVDWDGVLARYRPLLDRVGSRDDLSELLWEVVGELGSSHAYEVPPARKVEPALRVGFLGADLARDDDGTWRVARILPGEPSVPAARSPLLAPGAAVRVGDALLAVDGRPVDPDAGPGVLLVGTARRPTELTLRTDSGDTEGTGDTGDTGDTDRGPGSLGAVRRTVVVPLADERPLRYHDWVAGRRAATHAATGGRVGYLHVPDMMAQGWAQLHRDLHTEVARDATIVDLRANGGGHVSELVLEKLARRIRARSINRHSPEETWPSDAPRGPLVALTNQWAGSDGDIGTAMFRALRLGPVVGTRTWGGVIGIDGRYTLVDGTAVTQPRYAFWMLEEGWGIENHGVDPDVEVPIPPHAWGAGEDPQLDTAIRLALDALATTPPLPAPDPGTRPDRSAPTLPPRPGRT
jgi:tricorn protease